jgi:hypothetical protein
LLLLVLPSLLAVLMNVSVLSYLRGKSYAGLGKKEEAVAAYAVVRHLHLLDTSFRWLAPIIPL